MPFKISYPPHVKLKLKQLHRQAAAAGQADSYFQLLQDIDEFLRNEPLSFGEALYTLPDSKVQVRHGILGFVVVYWGVHEEKQTVILKDCRLRPNISPNPPN